MNLRLVSKVLAYLAVLWMLFAVIVLQWTGVVAAVSLIAVLPHLFFWGFGKIDESEAATKKPVVDSAAVQRIRSWVDDGVFDRVTCRPEELWKAFYEETCLRNKARVAQWVSQPMPRYEFITEDKILYKLSPDQCRSIDGVSCFCVLVSRDCFANHEGFDIGPSSHADFQTLDECRTYLFQKYSEKPPGLSLSDLDLRLEGRI